MKFLCPNCKAKYRIGSEKLVGRQAAKIRCRKCDYRIQIAYRTGSDEYDITATPTSVVPAPPAARAPKAPAVAAGAPMAAPRARPAQPKEETPAARRPTGPIPGLPGVGGGGTKSARGMLAAQDGAVAALSGAARRPLPGPSPQAFGAVGFASGNAAISGGAAAPAWPVPAAPAPLPPIPAPPPGGASAAAVPAPRPAPAASNQLADQFRQSVQAGGAAEELAQEGWFVGVNGVPLGPIPVGDLRELAMAGHIDRRSLVWRDGQAEWRPLGKFPQLARFLGDAGAAPPSVETPASVARPNGVNGHSATGFDVPRPVVSEAERPSAWGDLDDEDDEDEQPTTVKGRVSLPPPDHGAPAAPMAVPPPPGFAKAPTAPAFAPVPFSAPAPRVASELGAPRTHSAPPVAAPEGLPASTISTTPEPVADDADARMMRPRGRGRLYLIVLAIVTAFALGAIITRAIEPPVPAEEPKATPEPSRALAPTAESAEAESGETQNVVAEEELSAPSDELELVEPAPARRVADNSPVVRSGTAPPAAPSAPTQPAKTGGSLLSGLGAPQTPGPSTGVRPGADDRGNGAGLDATAIQRTVRRYSPAVRQNCWQRALNTRAPGVPSSAKVTASINVDASGRVDSVTVSGAPKGYPGLARCIEGSVKGWQFPRAGGQTVTNVPFMFVGQ